MRKEREQSRGAHPESKTCNCPRGFACKATATKQLPQPHPRSTRTHAERTNQIRWIVAASQAPGQSQARTPPTSKQDPSPTAWDPAGSSGDESHTKAEPSRKGS